MEQKLEELKSQVKSLLEEYPEGIKVNSFWGYYERKYRKLPEPKVFRVKKRSEILDLCNEVYRKVGSGGAMVIHLKSVDHSSQRQPLVSTCAGGAVGGKQHEQTQSQVSAKTVTPTQATMNQFSAGGNFYERFYEQTDRDCEKTATGPQNVAKAQNVAKPAFCGSYSSLMARQNACTASVQSATPAPYSMPHVEQFAIPSLGYPTPRSHDSSASQSSDGRENSSPAPNVQHSDPRHLACAVPTSLWSAGRSPGGPTGAVGGSTPLLGTVPSPRGPISVPGVMGGPTPLLTAGRGSGRSTGVIGGQGRRTHYSREQLNSVAEDCIDRLSVAKDYVSLDRISRLLCQDFEVSSLDELGLRQIDELACVNEHKRLECKVNAYIQNFVKVCEFQLSFQQDNCFIVLSLFCV